MKIIPQISTAFTLRLFAFLCLLSTTSPAQLIPEDSLQAKIEQYNAAHPQDVLHIVTDKDIYLPGETIWFAGYLLKGVQKEKAMQADLLGVALLREDSTAVSLRKNYLLEQGLCPGSLTLPENLTPGRYLLLATTNIHDKNKVPVHQFFRHITVMTETAPKVDVTFERLKDRPDRQNLYIDVFAKMPSDISTGGLRRSRVTYNLPGAKKNSVKFDKNGHARIKLSKEAIRDTTPVLFTRTRIDREETTFNLSLPDFGRNEKSSLEPLLENDPAILAASVVNDTLMVYFEREIKDRLKMAVTHLHTENTEETPPFMLKKGTKIELVLNEVNKGVNELNLVGPNGEVVHNDLFFAHYDRKNKVHLKLDKEAYHTRDSIQVQMQITDYLGNELGGVFTVSCVQINRLFKEEAMDMEAFYYTHPLVDNSMDFIKDHKSIYADKQVLGNLLKRKSASRSSTGLSKFQTAGTLPLGKSKLEGKIEALNYMISLDSLGVVVDQNKKFNIFPIDSTGYFIADPKKVVVPENSDLKTSVVSKAGYLEYVAFSISDPLKSAIDYMSYNSSFTYNSSVPVQSTQNYIYSGESYKQSHTLETVFLYGKKSRGNQKTNACGDYVCIQNTLNCTNLHTAESEGNRPPVKGKVYKMFTDAMNRTFQNVVYEGCDVKRNRFQIFTSREFGGMDKEKYDNPYADFYLPTLHWEAFKTATADKEIQFGFYTSDLTGTFELRIEGIATNGDFISAEKTFRVTQ